MSNYHCYLCASDDGIQLDIFGDRGKAICDKIESCLSVKIEEGNAIATKICHKCAFELDACSKFVAKYKQSRDSTKGKNSSIKGHCSLCSEPGKIGYIFDCKDGKPANDTLHKIQEIFKDSTFNDKRKTSSICLDCRYNLDVLFDLKCIYESTPDKLRNLSEKGLQLSELPKTKTRVVKRKTTYIPVPRLNGTKASDTDSSSAASTMPYTRKRTRAQKKSEPASPPIFRTCEQCKINVENGIDMYRYHRTGITVCKDCWLAMDPEKLTQNKRKKLGIAGGEVGTRRCAIILKDVLTNPAKYENIYKVEKDEHGNTTYIVTDDGSEIEEKEKAPAKRSQRSPGSVASPDDAPAKTTRPLKRRASTKSTDLDDEPPAKKNDKGKNTTDDVKSPAKMKNKMKKNPEEKASPSTNNRTRKGQAISDTEVFESRTRRRFDRQSTDSEKNAKAASDAELTKPPAKTGRLRTKLDKSQLADLSAIETKTAVTTKVRKTAKNAAPVVSSPEKEERPVRRTRALSLTNQDATASPNRQSNESRNAKSVSEVESPPAKIRKIKTKSLSPKISATDMEVENPYTCTVCQVEFKNKLIGMKHELTHAKQPEVKLQRVAIPEIIVEEAPAESSLIEEPEEQSHDVSSTSGNRPGDSENVQTSVPVASHKETSIDVLPETKENEKNLQESKSSPKALETTAEVQGKQEQEEKSEDMTLDSKDKIEDKVDGNENKDKDNVHIPNEKIESQTAETEDKNGEKADETEDKNEDKTEETEDKNEDKTEDTEDKNEDKTEKTVDKNVDQTEETEDKNEDKGTTTELKIEDNAEETEDKTAERKDETANETEETQDIIESRTVHKTQDKIQSKIVDKTEDQIKSKTVETEDQIKSKTVETEDKIESKTVETEDNVESKTVETEDNVESKTVETEDNVESRTVETEDKIDSKTVETENKIENKTEAPDTTEADTTVGNENSDDINTENTQQVESNDTLTIAESDKNDDDKKTKITEVKAADSENPESTNSEEVDKEVENAEPLETLSEQVLTQSVKTSEKLNGVNVQDDANSKVNNANGVEKDAVALNCDTECETVDDHHREKSIESNDASPVTSTSPEKNNEIEDVVKDKVSSDDGETTKNLEAEAKAEAEATEASIFSESNATKDSEGSESIVNDVLTEVFDLATAEVKKRLENEPSRDEKCTTPVSETLENISREISNSADMPSLEPLVADKQTSNIQS